MIFIDQIKRSSVSLCKLDSILPGKAKMSFFIDGKIVADGTPKEVFADDVPRFGLTLPPATETANLLKTKGFVFDEVVINEDELVEGICKQLR